jgi:hypothetical protein
MELQQFYHSLELLDHRKQKHNPTPLLLSLANHQPITDKDNKNYYSQSPLFDFDDIEFEEYFQQDLSTTAHNNNIRSMTPMADISQQTQTPPIDIGMGTIRDIFQLSMQLQTPTLPPITTSSLPGWINRRSHLKKYNCLIVMVKIQNPEIRSTGFTDLLAKIPWFYSTKKQIYYPIMCRKIYHLSWVQIIKEDVIPPSPVEMIP